MNNETQINMFLKQDLADQPPIIGLLANLSVKPVSIRLYCERNTSSFKAENIEIIEFANESSNKTKNRFIQKFLNWWRMNRVHAKREAADVNWYLSVDAFIACFPVNVRKTKLIVSLYELYDKLFFYKFLCSSLLRITKARVVCPDHARSAIIKTFYKTEDIPYVLYNRPIDLDFSDEVKSDFDDFELEDKSLFKDHNTILYQGHINPERPIDTISDAVEEMGGGWKLVLMGNCQSQSYLDELLQRNKSTSYIGYVTPPAHLKITSLCDIGVITYDHSSLNHLFCAPNKVFEFGKFSKPVIYFENPNLNLIYKLTKGGEPYFEEDKKSIIRAIENISDNYHEYSKGSQSVYKKLTNENEIERILGDVS